MARRKEGTAFQIEIRGEPQWRQLCRKEGLIVVDVYPGWTGPCTSIVNFLKRMKADIAEKHEAYSNKLTFATACSDKIEDLLIFKDHAAPTFLFLAGGGKAVRVFKGCHIPNLAKAISEEFERELKCMEGKARRNVISIDDDETRKKKFEAEAQRLGSMLKDEEEPSTEIESARRESSVMLETIMSAYTIAVIQPFLLKQMAEIKDYLSADFNVLGAASVKIDDSAARKLYRIPYEVEETISEDPRKSLDKDTSTAEESDAGSKAPKKKVPVVLPSGLVGETTFLLLESSQIKNIIESGGKPSGALQTADDWLRLKVGPRIFEQAVEHSPNSLHASYGKGEYLSGVWCPRRYDDKRHILLTYFPQFLVEKVLPFEVGEEYVPKRYVLFVFPGAKNKDLADLIKNNEADVFAHGRLKINPEIAEKIASGKISEKSVNAPGNIPAKTGNVPEKTANSGNAQANTGNAQANTGNAPGKAANTGNAPGKAANTGNAPGKAANTVNAPGKAANTGNATEKTANSGNVPEKTAKSGDAPVQDDEISRKTQKLTSGAMLCVSVNRRNESLFQALQSFNPAPVHFSLDPVSGANETAALFPNLNAKYEEEADEVLQKYAARAKQRVSEKPESYKETAAYQPPKPKRTSGGADEEEEGDT